ncbi:MAG: FKBP-type peptidyl-prolyl cis-trans isomerase [Chitinophagaceae bacterium]|nr:FKBP-type peptidyl-prolyl cis-trans isomerase [Chitinophagaceae bacterium]MCA6455929.1 FKBP-type peptidyl-prolyl cis-trans isomerase [Chitinophagaceae bacterium]MCA6458550.1 FKBP-type peptidyl-prolyl cis-trans isomerase [Chitinophagaceae bacterium]MCA6465034.1 FKBP-type peptidyl-prolyl cis-trans isomerase [Chitinophagaceae bacterium]
MKKFVLSVLVLSMVLLNISCGKNDTSGCQPASIASEKAQLVAYCTANGINYTESSSGLLYEIIAPGGGLAPVSTSVVSVVYTGKLLNGTTFDATANPISLSLSSVIDGWKIGLPLIKKGGRIKLVIPSALAYSCTGAGTSIPPNSPLFFDVTLQDVR